MTRQPDPAASRAVLIGVADYAEPERWEPLPAVRTNVADLRALLCSADAWGLPAQNCVTLVDPRDRLAVLESISEAAEAARDTVLIYYSGHGATTEEDLLLTLSSTSSRNLGYSAVEFAAVRRVIQARRAMHAVILLDCCFSGKAHAMADPQSLIDTQIGSTSAYTLTSSARNSISLAPPGERHTAFTGELLRVLAGGSPFAGEFLTLAEMTRAVSNALVDKRMPAPRYSQSGPADALALVRNHAWAPAVAGPPAPRIVESPPPVVAPRRSAGLVAGIDLGGSASKIAVLVEGEFVTATRRSTVQRTPDGVQAVTPVVSTLLSARLSTTRLIMSLIGEDDPDETYDVLVPMGEVAQCLIAQLVTDIEDQVGRRARAAVLAVPSDFTAEQCDLLRAVGEAAGLSEVTVENSSVAAQIGAGRDHWHRPTLVFDLGGTSVDIAYLDGDSEPMMSAVDADYGLPAVHAVVLGLLQADLDMSVRLAYDRAFREAAERAVIELSSRSQTDIEVSVNVRGAPVRVQRTLTRRELWTAASPVLDRYTEMVRLLAGDQPRAWEPLLIGGGANIPAIVDRLDALAPNASIVVTDPALIARGAAMLHAGIGSTA